MSDTFEMDFEVTDTFGGEANYCWVKRDRRTYKCGTPDRTIVRDLKAFAGWTGMRAVTDYYSPSLTVRPRGLCQVAFASPVE